MTLGLYRADREEVQPRPMYEPILGEGEEGPSIGEEGQVWVEGQGIKCPPLVCYPLEVPEVEFMDSLL